jgi:hypothetical protein
MGNGGKTRHRELGVGGEGLQDADTGSSGKTEHRRLGTGRDNSKDLRCKDKGILFLTRMETGMGSEHNEDSAGRGESTGKRQAGVSGVSTVELRGGDGMRDDLLDKGTILTVDSVLGSERDESGVSTRVDTGKAGSEGKREGAAENCEGMRVGEADREGNRHRQCAMMWSGTGEAGGEGRHDAVESCRDDNWLGSKGMNAGVVDGEDSRGGNGWG